MKNDVCETVEPDEAEENHYKAVRTVRTRLSGSADSRDDVDGGILKGRLSPTPSLQLVYITQAGERSSWSANFKIASLVI